MAAKETGYTPINPENREQKCIAAAMDLAEKKLLDGTASSQLIVHFLKLATVEHELELEKLKQDTELSKKKTEAIAATERNERLMQEAMEALKEYHGIGTDDV